MAIRRRLVLTTLAFCGVAVFAVESLGRRERTTPPWTFEIEMRASGGTFAQLFWGADQDFVEGRSIRLSLQPGADLVQRLRFPIPSHGVLWLRFDPTDAPGEIVIGGVRLLDSSGRVLTSLDPKRFQPAHDIASVSEQNDGVHVLTTPGGADPYFVLPLGCAVSAPPGWDRLSRFNAEMATVIAVIVVGLLASCVLVIAVDAFNGKLRGDPAIALPALVWLVALFLVVFAASLALMRAYPLSVPFWDQWDAEARGLYLPISQCSLTWRQMFSLHNEHRVFFTRLLALILLIVDGQWDPRVQQVANAAIHALTAVVLAAVVWIANDRRHLSLLVLIVVLAFAPPFGWENTLVGFQSAFYFEVLFAVLALWLMTHYRAGSHQWYFGLSCSLCGLFSAAGGVLAPVAVAAAIVLTAARDRPEWRQSLATLLAAALVIALGIWTASPPLPHHAGLRSKNIADFIGAVGRDLAWPWVGQPGLSVVMWLPAGALLLTAIKRVKKPTATERLVAGLSIWVALQAGALAYGRGSGAPPPASRYQDVLSLGFVANTVALIAFLDRTPKGTLARRLTASALAIWLVVLTIGIDRQVRDALIDLTAWFQHITAQTANVRRFVANGDLADFESQQFFDLPYPDARVLAGLLRDPYIRGILPPSVRQPVPLTPRVPGESVFVPDGAYPTTPRDPLARAWGSYSALGNPARGRFESSPIPGCGPGRRLKFQVAGYLGLPQLYMGLKHLQSRRESEIRPRELAREDWTSVLVPCPADPYAIVAVDDRSDYWFAFRAPVEVGRWSPLAETLIESSPELLFVGLMTIVLVVRWT